MTDREQIIFNALRDAADRGLPCPDNKTLAVVAGYRSISGPARVVKLLEERGLIKVQRGLNWRIVTFTDTGRDTATRRIDYSNAQLTSVQRQRNILADIISEGGSFDDARRRLKTSSRRIAQMWRAIIRDLGWQAA